MAGEWEEGMCTATASAPLTFDLVYEGRKGKKMQRASGFKDCQVFRGVRGRALALSSS